MKLLTKAQLFFLTVLIFHFVNVQVIFPEETAVPLINEVMSSNQTTIQDEDGDYPDWIEIYNPGSSAVDLTGYGLSDRSDNPFKWISPSSTIESGKFLIIFASGKDKTGDNLHTNFKINQEGETLVLTNSSGTVCDSLETGEIISDISRGRKPDGGSEWLYFSEPTPGESNTTEGSQGYADSVLTSLPGGFYDAGISLELSVNSLSAEIRYTLDGADPADSSMLYSTPITIDTTTVVRARAFKTGYLPSSIITQTFFINYTSTLPVISLSTNPANLWDDDIGIYVEGKYFDPYASDISTANYFQNWERPVHMEYYEPNNGQSFSIDAGLKMFGNVSKLYPQKSLAIFARGRYGYNEIKYQFFPDISITEFNSIVLRSSGNDWMRTMFRDALCQSLVKDIDLDIQAYRPAVVFINGVYWGIHNIREKLNEDYLASHHGVDPDNVDIIGEKDVTIEGDNIQITELKNYIAYHYMDIGISPNYDYLKTQMDMNNFINYMVAEIYFGNADWGNVNVKYWRPKIPEGQWRWLLFDVEFGFGLLNDYTYNTISKKIIYSEIWFFTLFATLMPYEYFRNDFINQFADYLNTIFHPIHVIRRINEMKAVIEPEMPNHITRWLSTTPVENEHWAVKPWAEDWVKSMDDWYNDIHVMEDFAINRPYYVRSHIMNKFGLSDTVSVDLDVSHLNAGKIKLNTIIPENYPWNGIYFTDVPIQITALPNPGYRFTGWSGVSAADTSSITITLTDAVSVTANFEEDNSTTNIVIINEINYNSSVDVDPEDWIELYNPNNFSVDVSNWIFKDADDINEFVLPPNTTIGPNSFLVLCSDKISFHDIFPQVDDYIGNLGFNLSNAGELIRLYNSEGSIVDSLTFYDVDPWPVEPDGTGCSLALRDSDSNNSLPENWTYSTNYGTPGAVNDWMSGVDKIEVPIVFSLGQNYPNPFNPVTNIPFSIPEPSRVTIEVYSILGQRVATILDEYMNAGHHSIVFKADNLANGIYFYTIKASGFKKAKSMLLLK